MQFPVVKSRTLLWATITAGVLYLAGAASLGTPPVPTKLARRSRCGSANTGTRCAGTYGR